MIFWDILNDFSLHHTRLISFDGQTLKLFSYTLFRIKRSISYNSPPSFAQQNIIGFISNEFQSPDEVLRGVRVSIKIFCSFQKGDIISGKHLQFNLVWWVNYLVYNCCNQFEFIKIFEPLPSSDSQCSGDRLMSWLNSFEQNIVTQNQNSTATPKKMLILLCFLI